MQCLTDDRIRQRRRLTLNLQKVNINRVQWYYNNELQEVVTSIHFVKIEATFLQNSGFEPTLAGPSQIFSLML